ncbi:MAG TPA: sulfotransferase [Solirubrobacteraceae bacterium]|nr:sulfotransferase [Solirubrobacteraceae bacterium]
MTLDDGRGEQASVTDAGRGAQPADVAAVTGRIPDFFVVGHPKCGTTALYEMLMRHPQIYMPPGKEPWFFARELLVNTPPRPSGTPHTLDEYRQWFAGARPDQLVGEATSLYLWSRAAAGGIAEVRPDARIIAIVREPAAFLRSLHLEFVQIYVETEPDFRKAMSLEQGRREGRHTGRYSYWPQALMYSDYVRYVDQLRRYQAVFPPEQMLVLIYDDFRNDNEATLRRVLRFLDVEEEHPIETTDANPTVRVRSHRMHELLHALYVGHGPVSRAMKASIKAVTPRGMRRKVVFGAQKRLVFAEPLPPDEELMSELRRRFKPEVVALSEYLGRDLVALWGYDRLD